MPKVLDETEVDSIFDELDAAMTAEEEAAEFRRFDTLPEQAGDLSDGGKYGEARLFPTREGVEQGEGRAVARRAWSWNGTVTLLPLAWNPEGTRHDNARHYLLKRHCVCCHYSGFMGIRCPPCVKNNCNQCGRSTVKGKIIPCYYLREEDVPFPVYCYGDIACFLPFCPRQGKQGFKTQEDMWIHARMKHRIEYQGYLDSKRSAQDSELISLRSQVASLTEAMLRMSSPAPGSGLQTSAPPPKLETQNRKPEKRVQGTPEAPLYISDKDKAKLGNK